MPLDTRETIGWDIGGANIKAVAFRRRPDGSSESRVVVRPFEIWREREKLTAALIEIVEAFDTSMETPMALTMTAELADTFRTKREGVVFVFDAIAGAFPKAPIHPLSLAGEFVPLEEARLRPLEFAADNWIAGALYVAEKYPDCILFDVGSTTTDIIPVRNGRIAAGGRTDMERLTSGELVYTGILRTNPNTIADKVPVDGRMCRTAAEYFAVMADVYLLLGFISEDEYTCPTADGRDRTPESCRERLARLVCADGEMLNAEQTLKLARYLHERQIRQLTDALFQVLSGLEDGFALPAAVAGAGSFLASQAARRLGLTVLDLEKEWGVESVTALPARAAAVLLAEMTGGEES